jgi:hypothetical protein
MTAPERFAQPVRFPLHRGRRPYMTHSWQSGVNFAVVHNGPHDVVAYGRWLRERPGETASHYKP